MQHTDSETLTEQAWARVDARQFSEAHALFSRLCALTPQNPEVWMMRAVTQIALGDPADAEAHLYRAIELDASYADPWLHLGKLALARGQAVETVDHVNKALQLDADYTDAWMLRGAAQAALNQHVDAEASARKALALDPDLVQAEVQLAHALFAQGRAEQAAQQFRQILTRHPGLTEVEMALAASYAALGQHEAAANCYRNIVARAPQHARAHNELGNAWMALGDLVAAERSYRLSIALPDAAPEAFANLGLVHQTRGDFAGAADLCRAALARKPDSAPLHQMLATVLEFMGCFDEAIQHCDLALSHDPTFTEVAGSKGRILIKQGHYQACHDLLKPLVESGQATAKAKLVYAEASVRVGAQDDTANMLEAALRDDPLEKTERQQIHAALGRLYDAAQHYDQAFRHFQQSNALKLGGFDLPRFKQTIDELIATFNMDFLASALRSACDSSVPVFIVGMPRSGTSLLEQVLASHPDVYGAGELGEIQLLAGALAKHHAPLKYPQCMTAVRADELTQAASGYVQLLRGMDAGAVRIVDKMPHNFMHLGLIQLLFPQARVIHVRRDPLDTCLSCFTQEFTVAHAYTYDLGMLGAYYKQYDRLMQHWRSVLSIPMLEIEYETLVADQEAVSHKLLAFCGLEWNDAVLRFHETRRDVATASFDQVRQPLYKKSVQRWKHYEPFLAPLIAALK